MNFTKNILLGLSFCISLMAFSLLQAQNTYQPDLSMTLQTFEEQALSSKEEVWVIDFWASWCRPCIQSIPHMKELHEKYTHQGVRFISISWDRNLASWRYAMDQFKMPWQHLIVPKGQEYWMERHFPHQGIPTAFVIDQNGKVKKVSNVFKLDKAIYKAL